MLPTVPLLQLCATLAPPRLLVAPWVIEDVDEIMPRTRSERRLQAPGATMCGALPFNPSGIYFDDELACHPCSCQETDAYCSENYDLCGGTEFTSRVILQTIPNTCCGAEPTTNAPPPSPAPSPAPKLPAYVTTVDACPLETLGIESGSDCEVAALVLGYDFQVPTGRRRRAARRRQSCYLIKRTGDVRFGITPRREQTSIICATAFHDESKCADDFNDCCAFEGESQKCSGVHIPKPDPECKVKKSGVCAPKQGGIGCFGCFSTQPPSEKPFPIMRTSTNWELHTSWSRLTTKVVKIGTIQTLDRRVETSLGTGIMNGLQLFFHMLAFQQGGVKVRGDTYVVELVVAGDGGDPGNSRRIVKNLIEDEGIQFFIGGPSDDGTRAVADEIRNAGAVFIDPYLRDPSIIADRPTMKAMSVHPKDTFKSVVSELLPELAVREIWVIKEIGQPDALLACSAVEDYVDQYGLSPWMVSVGIRSKYSLTEVRGAIRNRMKPKCNEIGGEYFRPEAIFVCVRQELCSKVLQGLVTERINSDLLIMNECFFDGYSTDLGQYGPWVQFTSTVIQWTPMMTLDPYGKIKGDISNISVKEFVDIYMLQYQTMPNKMAALAFSAAAALVRAIEIANSIDDPALVVNALDELDLVDISGRIHFDKTTGMNIDDLLTVQYQQSLSAVIVSPHGFRQDRQPQTVMYPKTSWAKYRCSIIAMSSTRSPHGHFVESLEGMIIQFDRFHLKAIGWDELTVSYRICTECPEGRYGKIAYEEDAVGRISTCTNCVPVPAGMHASELPTRKDEVVLTPCVVGTFSAFAISECIPCPGGRFQNETMSGTCLDCAAGMYSNIVGASSCVTCKASDYGNATLFSDLPGANICTTCPPGGLCERDSQGLYSSVTNRPGFFRLKLNHTIDDNNGTNAKQHRHEFIRCWHNDVCLPKHKCLDGQSGLLCGSCEPNFKRVDVRYPCFVCHSMMISLFYLFLDFVLLSGYAMIIAGAMTAITSSSRRLYVLPAMMKQITHYIVIMKVLTPYLTFQIGAFSEFLNVLAECFAIDAFGSASLAMSCLVEKVMPSMHMSAVHTRIGWLTLPIYYVSDVIWYFSASWMWGFLDRIPLSEERKRNFIKWKPDSDTLFSLLAAHTYLLHTRIMAAFQIPFECRRLDELRFRGDISILCGSPGFQHSQRLALYGIVALGVGLPILVFSVISRFERDEEIFKNSTIFALCGFLVIGFKTKYWYWEFVQQLRKLCMIGTAVILKMVFGNLKDDGSPIYSKYVVTAMLFVMSGFMAGHVICKPYDNRNYFILDRLEAAMYAAIIASILAQLICWDPNYAWTLEDAEGAIPLNIFITVVAASFHLRFMFLALWGLVGHSIFSSFLMRFYGGKRIFFTSDGLDISKLLPRGRGLVLSVLQRLVNNAYKDETQWKPGVFQKLLYGGFAEAVYWRKLKGHFGNRAHGLHQRMVDGAEEALIEVKRVIDVNYTDISDTDDLEHLLEQLRTQSCVISAAELHAGVNHALKHLSWQTEQKRASHLLAKGDVSDSSSQDSGSVNWYGSGADSESNSEQSQGSYGHNPTAMRSRDNVNDDIMRDEAIIKLMAATTKNLLEDVRENRSRRRKDTDALPPHRGCQSSLKTYIAALEQLIDFGKDEAIMLANSVLQSDPELLRSDSDDMVSLPTLYGNPMTYNEAEHDYYDSLADRYKCATSFALRVTEVVHTTDEYRAQVKLILARTEAVRRLVNGEDPRISDKQLLNCYGSAVELQQHGMEPPCEWIDEDSQCISRAFYQLYSRVLAKKLCKECEEAKVRVADFLKGALLARRGVTLKSTFAPFEHTRNVKCKTNGEAVVAQRMRIIIEISVTARAGSAYSERETEKGRLSQAAAEGEFVEYEGDEFGFVKISHKATYHVFTETATEVEPALDMTPSTAAVAVIMSPNSKAEKALTADGVRCHLPDRRERLEYMRADAARLHEALAAEEERIKDLRGEIEFLKHMHASSE